MAKGSSKGGPAHATRNDAPGKAKRQAHWTLRGPGCIAVHEMLGDFYGDPVPGGDDMAERIVQPGGQPDGTSQALPFGTGLPRYRCRAGATRPPGNSPATGPDPTRLAVVESQTGG
jgi:hypothetical protein